MISARGSLRYVGALSLLIVVGGLLADGLQRFDQVLMFAVALLVMVQAMAQMCAALRYMMTVPGVAPPETPSCAGCLRWKLWVR